MYPGEVDHIWKEYYNDFTRECDTHLMQRMKQLLKDTVRLLTLCTLVVTHLMEEFLE